MRLALIALLLLSACRPGEWFYVEPTWVAVHSHAELPADFARRLRDYQCATDEAYPEISEELWSVQLHIYPKGWPTFSPRDSWVPAAAGLWTPGQWSAVAFEDTTDELAITHEAWQHALPWALEGDPNPQHLSHWTLEEHRLLNLSKECP